MIKCIKELIDKKNYKPAFLFSIQKVFRNYYYDAVKYFVNLKLLKFMDMCNYLNIKINNLPIK